MYLVISLLVLRAGYGIWLYQFLIIAYLFTLKQWATKLSLPKSDCVAWSFSSHNRRSESSSFNLSGVVFKVKVSVLKRTQKSTFLLKAHSKGPYVKTHLNRRNAKYFLTLWMISELFQPCQHQQNREDNSQWKYLKYCKWSWCSWFFELCVQLISNFVKVKLTVKTISN